MLASASVVCMKDCLSWAPGSLECAHILLRVGALRDMYIFFFCVVSKVRIAAYFIAAYCIAYEQVLVLF